MASYQNTEFRIGGTLVQNIIQNSLWSDQNAVNIGSIATVLTPSSGKRYILLGGYISLSANGSVLFEDNAAGSAIKFRTPLMLANSAFYFETGRPFTSAAVGNVLKATASGAANMTGTLFYTEI